MPKKRSVYTCSECGYESSGWYGKCPSCGSWNTLVEETVTQPAKSEPQVRRPRAGSASPVMISSVSGDGETRSSSGTKELDRVLGGGLVKGSVILLGGDPGIGKSTLLLQTSGSMARDGKSVLYVSGEESLRQIALRARRTGDDSSPISLLSVTNVDDIVDQMAGTSPDVVVIDSIQTMACPDIASSPGSVTQVRESAARFLRCAKENGISVFLVGHVTKEGAIAGPRILEHMVDTVLYFEGDPRHDHRILRAVKNRFGSTNEIGIFRMEEAGMVPVEDPSGILLSRREEPVAGCSVVCVMEGSRPLNIEVQSLVTSTSYGNARRMSNGFDYNRMAMLLAVLEKKARIPLASQDAYVNIAGGLKIDDPAADLGVCAAVASAFYGRPIGDDTVFIGEVGLTGEVRSVQQLERRLAECAALGFKRAIIPKSRGTTKLPSGMELKSVSDVAMLVRTLFGKNGGAESGQ